MKQKAMRLHLGCNQKYFEGWVNVDIQSSVADVLDDVRLLDNIPDSSADLIYASHVLEHVGRHEWSDVLKVWTRKLKPGGILRIAVPDFAAAVQHYAKTKCLSDVLGLVCGGQRDQYDHHSMILDAPTLTAGLLNAGCTQVRQWDWRKTEHSHIDDYSQCYLPHMDKENGLLMSLNLEGVKGHL